MHRLSTILALLIPIGCASTGADDGPKGDDPEGLEVARKTDEISETSKEIKPATQQEFAEFQRLWELYRKKDPRWPASRDRFKRKSDGAANLMAATFLKYYMEVNAERSERPQELTAVKKEIVAIGQPCAPFLVDLMVLDRIQRSEGDAFVTDDITRGDCMNMLQRMGSEAVPDLMAALGRRDLGVKGRRLAASALGGTRDPRAFEPLVTLLKEDPSWQVRADACTGLGKLGDPRAIQPLNQAIMTDKDPAVRRRAQKARRQIAAGSSRYP
ncbi:MAG: HEAT repeat domain-containing protein [Planctomycetota bacterium]